MEIRTLPSKIFNPQQLPCPTTSTLNRSINILWGNRYPLGNRWLDPHRHHVVAATQSFPRFLPVHIDSAPTHSEV
jgi:hypothetical protein